MIADKDIEFVARKMCEHIGIDPDKETSHSHPATMTNAEKMENSDWYSGMGFASPRWMLFRKRAEEALAAHMAIVDFSRRGSE